MVVSAEERREINRQNGRKSRGPKTAEGKARSSKNALKHGLRAEAFALPTEDARELAELTDEWVDYYQPETPGLRALLDRAVLATIQQRRCARFLTAATAKQIRAAAERYDQEQEEEVERLKALFFEDPATAVRGLRRSAAGCRWLLSQWETLEQILLEEGCWRGGSDRDLATRLLGLRPDDFQTDPDVYWLRLLNLAAHPGDRAKALEWLLIPDHVPDRLRSVVSLGVPGREPCVAELSARVAEQLRELRERERHLRIAIEEPGRAEAEDRAILLGGAEGALLLRYERMHDSAFHRAYKQLLKGEPGDPEGIDAPEAPSAAAPVAPLVPFVYIEDDVHWEERLFPDDPPFPRVVASPVVQAAPLATPDETNGVVARADATEPATVSAPDETSGLVTRTDVTEPATVSTPDKTSETLTCTNATEPVTVSAPDETNPESGSRVEELGPTVAAPDETTCDSDPMTGEVADDATVVPNIEGLPPGHSPAHHGDPIHLPDRPCGEPAFQEKRRILADSVGQLLRTLENKARQMFSAVFNGPRDDGRLEATIAG